MQRSAELQVKRRMAKRRDPGARFLGFTSRQWPFLYVLFGNWLFALLFFFGARILMALAAAGLDCRRPPRPRHQGCGLRHIAWQLIGICIIAAQRLDPNMWVRRTIKPNSALDINTRFIL